MPEHYSVVIIGGGQAGLSMSALLKQKGLDHIIFEKHRVGYAWRSLRWDSFCLVTPNWQCQLPGYPYPGDDPHGFMGRDQIVAYIEAYAQRIDPPIREGVEVLRLRQKESGTYDLETCVGSCIADQVVVATGGYHTPQMPRIAERLPHSIQQLHSSQYKNPNQLQDGAILVIGTGQSGCQIAEDLHLAGRQVHLSVGGAPRAPRFYRGQDVVDWLDQMGYYQLPVDQHPHKEAVRTKTNHYVTGRGGGREIDLRTFALQGMQLHGRLDQIQGSTLRFKSDLKHNLDQADAVAESIKKTIDQFIENHQIDAPIDPPFVPVWQPGDPILELECEQANIKTVIWCTGYRMDFRWIEVPIFDGTGYPGHRRGVTPARGLYFLGLPWLYTWGSGRFSGIAQDATYLAERICHEQRQLWSSGLSTVNEVAIGS